MEEDPRYLPVKSIFLKQSTVQRQLDILRDTVEEAEDLIHYEQAHNPEILFAIDIIERFLRKKKRVCYGGTAINAILPKKLRFYDPERDLPDYDFFTPDTEADVQELVLELKKQGFSEVVQRIGMHKGTFKVLVNFIPIADITYLEPELYKIVSKRSIVRDGIHYTDPDFLRMGMYLELSRPRGQVERWEKVFERLLLLNAAFPPKVCKKSLEALTGKVHIPIVIRKALLDFVLDNNRILMGAEVMALYDWILQRRYKKNPSIQWFLHKNGMVVFLSPQAVRDGLLLRDQLGNDLIQMETLRGKEEIVPERVVLSFKGVPLVMIVQEVACHAYNVIPLKEGRKLHIGTLETLLTLYYSLQMFTPTDEQNRYIQFSLLCLTQKLVEMGNAFYKLGDKSPLPVFSIECSGYQKGYATLLREKFSRIKQEKKKRQTIKRNTSQKSTTRKASSSL
jgi:hypothetical protein